MPTSPYVRPRGRARVLALQPRDLDVLRAAERHRYLRTEHVHRLHFAGRSLRAAQMRLRELWVHRYLERIHVASVIDGRRIPPRGPGLPVYALGAQGALALNASEGSGAAAPEIGGASTVQHHLVVTDFLVSLELALRARGGPALAESVHEWDLWKRLVGAGEAPKVQRVVPDGAFTVRAPGGGDATYYLEVVRAGVRAGNGTLWDKMLRASDLNHRGFFARAYGHARVRRVLFLTTSGERAETFRRIAESLPHGRRLFAFGSYEAGADGALAPERILSLPWKDAAGLAFTLADELAKPA